MFLQFVLHVRAGGSSHRMKTDRDGKRNEKETESEWFGGKVPPPNSKSEPREKKYIYIYIYVVKSITGPSLGVFKVNNWAKSTSRTGPRSFSHYKNWGFKRFFLLNYHCVCVCVFLFPIIWQFSKNCLFQKRVQKLGFSIFCVLSLNFENYLF